LAGLPKGSKPVEQNYGLAASTGMNILSEERGKKTIGGEWQQVKKSTVLVKENSDKRTRFREGWASQRDTEEREK